MRLLSRSIRHTTMKVLVLALLGLSSVTSVMAYESSEDFTLRMPVNEEVLDSMRGGFQLNPKGPFMSFGIERNVFDNEKLISSTVLKIPDMAHLGKNLSMRPFANHRDMKPVADQQDAKPLAAHPSDIVTFIQSGPGNSAPSNLSSMPPFMTIIQNSLDNRAIRTETVIDVTVEALSWARAQDLGTALSLANIEAIRH